MSFRRSYGTGSYGPSSSTTPTSSLLTGGYSSRGYSGYSSSIGSSSYPSKSGYSTQYNTYSSSSTYSPSTYSTTSYTPSSSYLHATSGSNPITTSYGSTRIGRSSSLRSKSLPREQQRRERDRSLQRYTPSYSSHSYTPSYTPAYSNSYIATRGLINKARSKSSGTVTTSSKDTALTPTLSTTSSSGYGGSSVGISLRYECYFPECVSWSYVHCFPLVLSF